MPRLVSPASAATTASPSSATPFTWPRSTFHASSASRPVVAASPFMTQAPANTSAVLASTYVPVTAGPLAASVANVRLESASDSAIFFMVSSSRLPVFQSSSLLVFLLQLAAEAVPAAGVRAHRVAIGPEASLRLHAPPRGLVITIVRRPWRLVHHSIDIHALGPQPETVNAHGDFRRGQRFHIGNPHAIGRPAACRMARSTAVLAT